jgi:hypothetical protein
MRQNSLTIFPGVQAMYLFSIPDDFPTPTEWPQKAYLGLVAIGYISLIDHKAVEEIWRQAREIEIDIRPFEDTRLYTHQLRNLVELFD